MAQRPIFTPSEKPPFVDVVDIEFKWHPGFATSQLQKSVKSLHEAAGKRGIAPILETSRKSTLQLGRRLSAFNLPLETPDGQKMSVECAYQGSKVFVGGGPYRELYSVSSYDAKTDGRLRNSGDLIGFNFCGQEFPIEPKTAFYDWLYLKALYDQGGNLLEELSGYKGFSDIVFNPKRSLNCQAHAAALFVSLSRKGWLDADIVRDSAYYLAVIAGRREGVEKVRGVESAANQLEFRFDAN